MSLNLGFGINDSPRESIVSSSQIDYIESIEEILKIDKIKVDHQTE